MDPLAQRFTTFAEDCEGSSPLYRSLSLAIAADPEILEIAQAARSGQPVPNLLFGAVHSLLLDAPGDPLGAYYASLVREPRPSAEAFRHFHRYVLAHRAEIEAMLRVRLVQTNEVRRAIVIASAFARLAREFPDRWITLVELGASAGLNLLFDRYAYEYIGHPPFGDQDSPLRLQAEARGLIVPPSDLSKVRVADRVGVDLHPLDLGSPQDLRWLRALIWPEHTERRALLDRAAEMQRRTPVRLVEGDAVALLPDLVAEVREDHIAGIFHTFVANQLGADGRAALLKTVNSLGRTRDLIHLHNNIEPHLHATFYRSGERHDLPLARIEGHARWVEWLDPAGSMAVT